MAKNFEALIKAVLNTNGIDAQIKNEIENKTVNLRDVRVTVDSTFLRNSIDSALSRPFNININPVINGGGRNLGRQILDGLESSVNTGIEKTMSNALEGLLGSRSTGMAQTAIDRVMEHVNSAVDNTDVHIQRVTETFRSAAQAANGLRNFRIDGVDDAGQLVRIFTQLDADGNIAHTTTTLVQNFEDLSSAVRNSNQDFNRLLQLQKQIQSLDRATLKLDTEKNAEELRVIEQLLQSLRNEYIQLVTTSANGFSTEQFERLNREATQAEGTFQRLQARINDTSQSVGALEATTLDNKMNAWLEKNSRAAQDYGTSIQYLRERLKDLVSSGTLTKESLQDIDREFKDIQQSAIAAGKAGKSFGDRLKGALGGLAGFFTFEAAFDKAIELLQDMYQQVYDIDSAMVNLRKVTDETAARYDRFLSSSAESAKELGRSVSSLIEQSATWAKLGYTLDQAEELAKLSSIYANVAEVDDATAVSDMVTAMKAFNIEAGKAVTVIDPLNELGNTFATDAAALGDALSKSASAMNAAGTDMYKTLAMITGGAEITQNAGEFGNFLKVASMRLRGKRSFMPIICENKGLRASINYFAA